jgi:hypothetical protein
MKQLSPEVKHSILTHYTSPLNHDTLDTILCLHDVKASRRAVELWRRQWDGTAASLQHKKGAGRPRILTQKEVKHYVATPIRQKNRKHHPIHYHELKNRIETETGKTISVDTIERYGREDCGGVPKTGKKRTSDEC